MARQRSTFGKLQRDRDKQAKAVAKQEKRAARAEAAAEAPPAADRPADQAGVLDRLAELHTAFEAGALSIDEFESRRDQLRSQLQID